jgi:hypothetical protein
LSVLEAEFGVVAHERLLEDHVIIFLRSEEHSVLLDDLTERDVAFLGLSDTLVLPLRDSVEETLGAVEPGPWVRLALVLATLSVTNVVIDDIDVLLEVPVFLGLF